MGTMIAARPRARRRARRPHLLRSLLSWLVPVAGALLVLIPLSLVPTSASASPVSARAVDDPALSAVDSYVGREVAKTHVPGAALVVVDKDGTLLESAYGDHPGVHRPQIIGSTSKSFTALAIMQLVEAGRVDLDAPVSTYLPDVEIGDRITARRLLTHTGGLGADQRRNELSGLGEQGGYEYSNVGYQLLGEIVAAASGSTYEDYLRVHILDPLGMKDTYTSLEAAKAGGLVPGHRNWFGVFVSEELEYPGQAGWGEVPAGYIISSAADMRRYLQMYLRGGEGIISRAGIDTMLTGTAPTGGGASYGMGWNDAEAPGSEPLKSHDGLVENYASTMLVLPERGVAAVMLINANDFFVADGMYSSISEGLVAHLTGRPGTAPVLSASRYVRGHVLFDAVLLAVALVALAPALMLPRWWRSGSGGHTLSGGRRRRALRVVSFLLLHIAFPLMLFCLPYVAGRAWFAVRAYAPDLHAVVVGAIMVSVAVGLVKGLVLLRRRIVRPSAP